MSEKTFGGTVFKRVSAALKRKVVKKVQRGSCTVHDGLLELWAKELFSFDIPIPKAAYSSVNFI